LVQFDTDFTFRSLCILFPSAGGVNAAKQGLRAVTAFDAEVTCQAYGQARKWHAGQDALEVLIGKVVYVTDTRHIYA